MVVSSLFMKWSSVHPGGALGIQIFDWLRAAQMKNWATETNTASKAEFRDGNFERIPMPKFDGKPGPSRLS